MEQDKSMILFVAIQELIDTKIALRDTQQRGLGTSWVRADVHKAQNNLLTAIKTVVTDKKD